MATQPYLTGMGASITRGVNDSGGELKHTLFAKLILSGMHRPNIPAPGSMIPEGKRSTQDLESWLANTNRMLQLIDQASGKDLVANKFKNPFLPIGQMNLMDGFEITVEHNERHIRQMEERVGQIRE